MAITAVIGDTNSVGNAMTFNEPGGMPGEGGGLPLRNPQLATGRIRTIVAPHIVNDAVGGAISADFTIPSEEALRWKPVLRYGATCWLFDGLTPIFYGWCEQPVWTQTGDCQMTLTGAWGLLGSSRMREAWEIWDLSQWTKGTGAAENKQGSVTVNSDGTLTLSIPAGTVAVGDRCSVDLLLFGEAAGFADQKLITAFEFDVSDSANFTATRRLRVIGKASAAAGSGDQLFDSAGGSAGVQGANNLNGSNQGGVAWPANQGYRCLRIEMIDITSGATLANDWYVTFDRIRVSSREALFPTPGNGIDTAAIARDVLTNAGGGAARPNLLQANYTPEFYKSKLVIGSPDSNTAVYKWGLDPRTGTGTAPNSGVTITGFSSLEWQSPADVLAALVAIDGYHVGFYLPYNGRGGYDPPGNGGGVTFNDVGSFWLSAPPQLYYQAFPDPLLSPDYVVYTRQGAQVTPNAAAQPLIDIEYTNYQTTRGRQLSVVVEDGSTLNYAAAQGFVRAEDYTIQPAVGDTTMAQKLGQQQLQMRRQPYSAATITIQNDGSSRNAILKSGATVSKLSQIRPGSVRIADIPASSGLRAGYATHVEWWGATLGQNERVELSLAQPPGRVSHQRAHGRLVERLHRSRIAPFGAHS